MTQAFRGWEAVAQGLVARANGPGTWLNEGQRRALLAISERLVGGHGNACRGVVVADEVGMGKTRVASSLAAEVTNVGGRVAILVPPGLDFQWRKELRGDALRPPPLVQTLWRFLAALPDTSESPLRSSLLLISHRFANWRMGSRTWAGRWGLLPNLVALRAKHLGKRWPVGFREKLAEFGQTTSTAADIVHAHLLQVRWDEANQELDTMVERPNWRASFCVSSAYSQGSENRERLERAVGWGLGRFDLIVIDEAHKERGDLSSLTRLLERVVHPTHDPARLALTATPLALGLEEWEGTLERIGLYGSPLASVTARIHDYAAKTTALRSCWRTSEAHRVAWQQSSADFQQALFPYVLRRDKREDPLVMQFATHAGTEAYRASIQDRLEAASISTAWRHVLFAAEGLSAAVHGAVDPASKRLRTTIANGLGVATIVDAALAEESERDEPASEDESPEHPSPADEKRAARARFWEGVIRDHVASAGEGDSALYEHPQIRRAVELLEAYVGRGEKVLVFGKFTRPMRALVDLLNARAKLRTLQDDNGEPWPQEHLHLGEPDSEGQPTALSAVDAAATRQLGLDPGSLPALAKRHTTRYRAFETQRAWLRHNLHTLLEKALTDPWLRRLQQDAAATARSALDAGDNAATLTRALWELLSPGERDLVRANGEAPMLLEGLARAFRTLVVAATDRDSQQDEEGDEEEPTDWPSILDIVREEFGRSRGGLARLLNGEVKYATRRLLQAAFNRVHSFPKVLVAQSVVGREGLNLHEACRVVLQLHPEWNPGVAEQQIGRVDRIEGWWQTQLRAAIAAGTPPDQLPRIEVVGIVFGGTYDEHNWSVLHRRWDDLRAQLHGVVVPALEVGDDPCHQATATALNKSAPHFSPRSS